MRANCLLTRAVPILAAALAVAGQEPAGRSCKAITALDQLISTGLELSHQGAYGPAADCYRKAVAMDPKLGPVQLNLGLAEFKQGRFERAVAPFRAALELDPASFQARTLLGMSYYGERQYGLAAKTLAAAVEGQPDNDSL